MPEEKKKIVILGGGMAGLTAAFELTRQPGWQQHYDITIYEQGWRLGGKGASGRSQGEEKDGAWESRIEEHGLHVLLGFYDKTFALLEECYQALGKLSPEQLLLELNRPPTDPRKLEQTLRERFSKLDQMLEARDEIHFREVIEGEPRIWPLRLPPRKQARELNLNQLWRRAEAPWNKELPVEEASQSEPQQLVDMLLASTLQEEGDPLEGDLDEEKVRLARVRRFLEKGAKSGEEDPRDEDLPLLVSAWLRMSHDKSVATSGYSQEELLQRLILHRQSRWDQARPDDDTRRKAILRNLTITIVSGLIKEGLYAENASFSTLDDRDFRQWLREKGAAPEAYNSPIVQAGYNLTFSQEGQFAAGAALQGLVSMLRYKKHLYYKMRAGMGEVVFAPLYLVLKARGVKFKFFHHVEALHLSADKQSIDSITLKPPETSAEAYRPLGEVDGMPCWPVEPFHEHPASGKSQELSRGEDFDTVVLAIPVGALPSSCGELMEHHEPLASMIQNAQTTATQASQLWFDHPLEDESRWKRKGGILASCPLPFDTWADCSQVLPTEQWKAKAPRSVVYLCGPLGGTNILVDGAPLPMADTVKRNVDSWLPEVLPSIWPDHPPSTGGLPPRASTHDALQGVVSRYDRANTHAWERYVLTTPGTTRYRLKAGESGIQNLFLAGDWVHTTLNTGCIEAATLAGMEAAQAIAQQLAPPPPKLGQPPPDATRQSRPRYIASRSATNWRGPFHQGETLLSSFFLECDYDALKALCDTYLNHPRGQTEYLPMGRFAIVQCARINDSRSLHQDHRGWGSMREREIGITIPVVGGTMVGDTFQPDRFLLFVPYIFVDTGVSVIVGREIYGFAKQLADVRMPLEPKDKALFTVKSLAIRTPGAVASEEEILRIERLNPKSKQPLPLTPPAQLPDATLQNQDIAAVFEGLVDALHGYIQVDPTMLTTALLGTPGMVFLKQFRDVVDSSLACYQAIVEAPFTISDVKSGWLLPPEELKVVLHSHHTHPIAEELGLKQNGTPVKPLLATVLSLDFTLGDGKVIWSAGS